MVPLCLLDTQLALCRLTSALWMPKTQPASCRISTAVFTSNHAPAQLEPTLATAHVSTRPVAHATSASEVCGSSQQQSKTQRTLSQLRQHGQHSARMTSAQARAVTLSRTRSWPALRATTASAPAKYASCCRNVLTSLPHASWRLHKAKRQSPWTFALLTAQRPASKCHLLCSQQQVAVQAATTASNRAQTAASRLLLT